MRFGAIVRQVRQQKGLSLRKLAFSCDLSPTYISKIERGEFKPPSAKVIIKIAKQLNCDPDWLCAEAGKIPDDIKEFLLSDRSGGNFRFLRRKYNLK